MCAGLTSNLGPGGRTVARSGLDSERNLIALYSEFMQPDAGRLG